MPMAMGTIPYYRGKIKCLAYVYKQVLDTTAQTDPLTLKKYIKKEHVASASCLNFCCCC